jgi:hypothetical protein
MRRGRYSLLLCFAATASAVDYDPAEVLQRVARKVEANFNRAPKYTCVETVTRDYSSPQGGTAINNSCAFQIARPESDRRLATTDRLRLEVTMAKTGEIYSWLGATHFNEGDISDVIKHGPIATGAFGATLAMIFRENSRSLCFARPVVAGGRPLLEYSYDVDNAESKYRVRTLLNGWFRTAYHGSILANPESGDVVRLTLFTAELPPVTGSCQTVTTMDFTRQQIGEELLLMPKTAVQRFVGSTGRETQNTITFSACRAYQAESTVTFFDESEEGADKKSRGTSVKSLGLPAGLRFRMQLTTPIPSDTAAAGDAFQGKLVEPLRDVNQDVLAPQGALVEGRLLQVQVTHGSSPMAVIVMRPQTIEINHAKVPLAAYRDLNVNRRERRELILPEFWEPNSGIFQFQGEHVLIGSAFRSDWRTASAGGR